MGLSSLVSNLVAVADRLTGGLQATVKHYPFLRHSVKGDAEVAAEPTLVPCVVELGQGRTTTDQRTGEQVPLRATLTFPRPVTVTFHDRFVLPDYTTGPVVAIDGVVNPDTGARYATAVSLGGQR